MAQTIEEINYSAGEANFKGLIAAPLGRGKHPALIIAHEATGLSQHTRDVAIRLSDLGYVAFAIDYVGGGVQLETMAKVSVQVASWIANPPPLRRSIAAAHDVLTRRPDVDYARIGAFGYCFGAQALVEYARTAADLRAVVGFHPGMSINRPSESAAIQARLLMFVGSDDPITPREHRLAFEDEMNSAGVDRSMVVYGGVGHSFTNSSADALGLPGVAYHAMADGSAWVAAQRFLEECGM